MTERRKHQRLRVFKGAKLVLGTSSVLDCVVRDLSSGGARIEIQNAVGLPEAVDVTFDNGRAFQPCLLKWRRLNQIGVEFFKPEPLAA